MNTFLIPPTGSIYGNKQVLYYYYTRDGGNSFTKFDPSNISSLAVGVYTVYALGWDGHILVRSDNPVTLNVGVTITLNANGGTDGNVTSVFATSGAAASTGNIAAASLPAKTGYTFNGFWTSGGIEVINKNGEWNADVSGYTDNRGNWTCSAASTLYAHWTPKAYTITLEGMEANDKAPIKVQVNYDGVLSKVTPHTKTNYTFAGYWTDNDDKGATLVTQLIDANGNWIKDVQGYTGHDGSGNPTWICPNDKSLFAKWTEDLHEVTVKVYPPEAGSVTLNGSPISKVENIGYVTHSEEMTAVPANAAWVFKEWQVTSEAHLDLEHYSNSKTKMKITATGNGQTLTAVFEKRYNLVGSKYDENFPKGSMPTGGMPGWKFGSGAEFTIHSYTADGDNAIVNMSYTCNLEAGDYFFEIHDREKGKSLGRKNGNIIYVLNDGGSVELQGGEHQDQSIFFYPKHKGQYTFRITYMRKDGDYYYPTVTVERPHQLHMGHVHAEIDNTSATNSGDTGGTLSATIGGSPISNDGWYNYGADIAYTAVPATGYTAKWYTDNIYSSEFSPQPPNSWTDNNVTHDENVYVRFTEKATTVTLSNDGHGKIQIGGVDKTETTVGVTTTRELTAVPNDGYKFLSWTHVSGDDIVLSSFSTNPTTLRGVGGGVSSGQEVRANFDYRWALKAESEGWGSAEFIIGNISTNASGDVVGYVEIPLAANTNYQFTMKDLLTSDIYKNNNTAVQFMTYTNHTDWGFDKTYTYNCGITTAGKGTYRFTWNITDKTMTVTYPTSYQVNYGESVGGRVTSVKDGENNDVPNGGYVCSGGSVTFTAAANTYYTFVGWCNNETYGDPFNTDLSWTNSNVTETQNSFAKFKSTNFVIYRTGDMAEDDRAAYDDVESYAGGTISEAIEFRMKVHRLDTWYTLCLPFTVSAVKVWDKDDSQYYDIIPYWRTGGTYYTGHYIIRTPDHTTNFAIENFDSRDRWTDPEIGTGYLPSANTPYIIQWHDPYFLDKYISFFGATNQTIPTSMNTGTNSSSDETVNIYGNNAMTSGTVRDAYMLDPDYGPSGAWLREYIGTDRTVLPFECFIRANETTTAKYRVLRRDAATDSIPTAIDLTPSLNEKEGAAYKILMNNRIYIIRHGRIYTMQGTLVKEGE